LGHLARDAGDHGTARSHYELALDTFTHIRDHLGITEAHLGLGHLGRDAGDHATARSHYEKALTLSTRIGSQIDVAETQWVLGLTAQASGNRAQAVKHWQAALATLATYERLGIASADKVRNALAQLDE
jgi:tetratricopeptide (TPR) repeat protein